MNNLFDQVPTSASPRKDNYMEIITETKEFYVTIKQKAIIAIDPGKYGGIVAMVGETIIGKWEMPLLGDDLDVIALCDIISSLTGYYNVTAVVEDVHSIYGTSSSSNFTFGYVCGQINATLKALRLKVIEIQPKMWQKQIWINSDITYQKKKKEGQKKHSIDTKATSACAVRRLFPNEDLRGEIKVEYYVDNAQNRKLKRVGQVVPSKKNKENDGLVDALLIAECARRLNY